jgi:hypothetical protein
LKFTPTFLALLLIALSTVSARTEEPWSSKQEAKPHAKTTSKDEKKKTSHAPAEAKAAPDAASRLKALESENLRLRQELAKKDGAGSTPGSEATSADGALAELKAGGIPGSSSVPARAPR